MKLSFLIAVFDVQFDFDHFYLYFLLAETSYGCSFTEGYGLFLTFRAVAQVLRKILAGPIADWCDERVHRLLQVTVTVAICVQLLMLLSTRDFWTLLMLQMILGSMNALARASIYKVIKMHLQSRFPRDRGRQRRIINHMQAVGQGSACVLLGGILCIAYFYATSSHASFKLVQWLMFSATCSFGLITLALALTIRRDFLVSVDGGGTAHDPLFSIGTSSSMRSHHLNKRDENRNGRYHKEEDGDYASDDDFDDDHDDFDNQEGEMDSSYALSAGASLESVSGGGSVSLVTGKASGPSGRSAATTPSRNLGGMDMSDMMATPRRDRLSPSPFGQSVTSSPSDSRSVTPALSVFAVQPQTNAWQEFEGPGSAHLLSGKRGDEAEDEAELVDLHHRSQSRRRRLSFSLSTSDDEAAEHDQQDQLSESPDSRTRAHLEHLMKQSSSDVSSKSALTGGAARRSPAAIPSASPRRPLRSVIDGLHDDEQRGGRRPTSTSNSILSYFSLGLRRVWRHSVVRTSSLIYCVCWFLMYTFYTAITLTESARFRSNSGSHERPAMSLKTIDNFCNGQLIRIFEQGVALNLVYVVGAFLYGSFVARLPPRTFFSVYLPLALLIQALMQWTLLVPDAHMFVSALLTACFTFAAQSHYIYCQMLGLALLPARFAGFYGSLLGVGGSLVQLLPSVFTWLALDEQIDLLLVFLVTVTLAFASHHWATQSAAAERLRRVELPASKRQVTSLAATVIDNAERNGADHSALLMDSDQKTDDDSNERSPSRLGRRFLHILANSYRAAIRKKTNSIRRNK